MTRRPDIAPEARVHMKSIVTTLAISAFASAAFAADYSVFRVCEDKHVIKTSDGAEAGRVEYIVVDPSSHRLVSTIVSGGAVGERLVPVPVESISYRSDNEIVLTQITRERLVSAPVIERTQISSALVIQPTMVERSFTHFGVQASATSVRTDESSNRTPTTATSRTELDTNARPPGAANRTEAEINAQQRSTTTTRANENRPGQSREEAERNALGSTRSGQEGSRDQQADPRRSGRTEQGATDPQQPQQRREQAEQRERGQRGEDRSADTQRRNSQSGEKPEAVAERTRQERSQQPPQQREQGNSPSGAAEKSERHSGAAKESGEARSSREKSSGGKSEESRSERSQQPEPQNPGKTQGKGEKEER